MPEVVSAAALVGTTIAAVIVTGIALYILWLAAGTRTPRPTCDPQVTADGDEVFVACGRDRRELIYRGRDHWRKLSREVTRHRCAQEVADVRR